MYRARTWEESLPRGKRLGCGIRRDVMGLEQIRGERLLMGERDVSDPAEQTPNDAEKEQ